MITCIINILMILLIGTLTPMQNDIQKSDMQGLIKLAKYVTWPMEESMTKTTIMIAPQSDATFKAAENLAASNKILDFDIELKRITDSDIDDDDIFNANIIFIESGAKIDIDRLLQKVADKHILTITNDISILEKGCMFYVRQNFDTDETTYYYYRDAIMTSPLRVSALLLRPDHNHEKQ